MSDGFPSWLTVLAEEDLVTRPKLRQAHLNRIPCPTIISALACPASGGGGSGVVGSTLLSSSPPSSAAAAAAGIALELSLTELGSSGASKAKQAACIQHTSLGCKHVLVTFSVCTFDFAVSLV